ncbi:MAG: type II toxin-antitoxin system VapC family toxin [Spirochaetaceae bacterium]|nr:MAG: type II toxin-antitoxin system VapC family toxin [Spirochaetaceae bacterium]
MRIVDTNLLIYAHVAAFDQHSGARSWLDEKLRGFEPLGLPWPSLLGFLRLVSNPRIFERPESLSKAWQQVREWLDCRTTWIPQPTERHREVLDRLLSRSDLRANLIPDAHLAAMAIEHGLILCSTDGDFSRFPELRWENPLA